MTAELLGSISGIVLSLLFSYIPGLSDWYARLTGEKKRLIMAGLLLITALVVFGLSCANLFDLVACSQDGVMGLLKIFITALIANQSAYLITTQPATKKESE
ncbi:MAG: hypothetical protein AB9888_00260 [Bacteroidales bacterium]